ncbi:hypothetical protein GR157_36245 [Burkholderia sp. 4701]|nr:hypothetical protein [Burkholderia sp. 4701]MXN87363.1 hypothetical protein [Burkholderia sp. 4812]
MNALSSYHDAEIGGIAYTRALRSVLLSLEQPGGKEAQLLFSGVRAFRVNDYGLENVVSRTLVSTSRKFSREEIRDYVQWAQSEHNFKAPLTEARTKEIEAALSRGKLLLFVVEPSVGAEIVILCAGVSVRNFC